MLKNILNLKGAQQLNKEEQKEISGGRPMWCGYCSCPDGTATPACGVSQSSACYGACSQ